MSYTPAMQEFKNVVSRNLRKAIGNDPQTRADIARSSGITEGHIRLLEKGESHMSLWTAFRLSGAVGIGINDLLEGYGDV